METIRRGIFGTSAEMSFSSKIDEDYKRFSEEYDSERETSDSFWHDELVHYKDDKRSKRLIQTINSFLHHISIERKEDIKRNFELIKSDFFEKPCKAAVLSVDIRNSTFLMDHCDDTKKFSSFIYTITRFFKDIVLSNYGVYDKFTGDGFICYFPEFYSGRDYLYYAIKTAIECHEVFEQLYKKKNIFLIS